MDRMQALQYFLEVAETGSFSKAAKSFGVPASSISRAVQNLEAELKVKLLHRTTRVVKLTELGELYIQQVRPAISALNNADELIREQPNTPSGVVRITSTPGYGSFCLMPALEKLRRQYPELVLDIELTDQISNLARDEVDIAIRATGSPPERSVARKLTDNSFVLVASKDYLKRFGTPLTLADLSEHKTLLYRRPSGVLHWQAKSQSGWQEVQTQAVLISNVGQTLVQEAALGSGLALVPEWGVGEQLKSGELLQIRLQDAELSISQSFDLGIYLLYQKQKYSLKKVQVTIDFLLAELSGVGVTQ